MTTKTFPTIALILPCYNAARDLVELLPAIMRQTLTPNIMLAIDSSSTDNTAKILANYPFQIHTIPKNEFDHGGTRKLATQLVDADIYIYLTQDAYPANENAFKEIVDMLMSDDYIACVYGRQLPKRDATPIAAHARIFNYPDISYVRGYDVRKKYGIKTCFNSDSFAAYKKAPLEEAGNFPDHLMTAEDAYIAARLLQHGYFIGYAADATVFHSHNFTLREEFHRYFSLGVFHGQERWILDEFSSATGEGKRFVKSELKYLIRQKKYLWIPRAILSTFIKYFAYQLGLHEKTIPLNLKKKWGINKAFWLKTTTASQ